MLLEETAVARSGDTLSARLAQRWEIWGPNGGYLTAIALRGAAAIVPAGHRPVSVSTQYVSAGKFDDTRVTAVPVKKGRSAWCVNVSLEQGDRVLIQSQVWTTDRAEGPRTDWAPMPSVPQPLSLPSYGELHKDRQPHPYWRNFDVRPVALPFPKDEQVAPTLQIWFRFPDFASTSDPFADHGRCVIPIDTMLWPTHWRTRPREGDYMAPSLDLSVWFHDAPRDSEWLLLETHSDVAGGGLIFGRARMWAEDGRLVASGASHMLHTPARTS